MFMRVTHYKMKPNAVEAAKAMLEQMQAQVMALPGVIRFTNALNDDGTGCVVAVVQSKETSDGNQESVTALWASFADLLDGVPQATGYEVFVDWSN